MVIRSIYLDLEAHLAEKEVMVITGMRRTGKTTAMQYLLEKTPHNNKLYLDLERPEYRSIFFRNSFAAMQADLEFLGVDFSKDGVIALDEVQLIPEVVSFVKYYHDHSPIKFILSGSSSYYLKNRITESLSGRKRVFIMYPLDFIEFLRFKAFDEISISGRRFEKYRPLLFDRYQQLYEEYIQFGGFPQVALAESPARKTQMIKDILNSYLELDVKILSDYSIIDDLYRLVSLLAGRIGNKLDYQKISVISGINRNKIRDYISLFESTYFIQVLKPYAPNPDRQIAVQPKFYFSDTGFVSQFAQVSSGALFENAIANQLYRLGDLNYFQKKTGHEIDFILNENHAIEVKETPGPIDLKILRDRTSELGIEQSTLIGRTPPRGDFDDFVWGGCIF